LNVIVYRYFYAFVIIIVIKGRVEEIYCFLIYLTSSEN